MRWWYMYLLLSWEHLESVSFKGTWRKLWSYFLETRQCHCGLAHMGGESPVSRLGKGSHYPQEETKCPQRWMILSKSVSEQGKRTNKQTGLLVLSHATLPLRGLRFFSGLTNLLVHQGRLLGCQNTGHTLWSNSDEMQASGISAASLQFFQARTKTSLTISWHLIRLLEVLSSWQQIILSWVRREDGLFPSLRDCRMHPCPCGRLPIMKEELLTGYAPESLSVVLFWLISAAPLP